MAASTDSLNILVTGGAEGVGLATVRALLQRGHKVAATACDAEGALAIRMAGALPVFPDLNRVNGILSALAMTKAEAVVHAGPQYYGGSPHASDQYAGAAEELVSFTAAVAEAAKRQGVGRIVSLSFGYLYEAGHGAAREGDHDAHDKDYAPMLKAESLIRESGLSGFIVRAGYVYGGNSADTAALADAIKRSQRLPAGSQPASWIHEDDLATAIVALLEAEATKDGVEIINAAAEATATPNEFCAALSGALGLSEPRFAAGGFLVQPAGKDFARQAAGTSKSVLDSSRIRGQRFGLAAAATKAWKAAWRRLRLSGA